MIHEQSDTSAGFSFLEMLAALTAATIVLATVFGVLTRSTATNHVEMERSDLQGQARHALEVLSRDVMLAGTDLPPEFPAFSASSPAISQIGDRIEILGNLRGDATGSGPSPVASFDGYTARLLNPPPFAAGDLVLLFDDKPTRGNWLLGVVSQVRSAPVPEIDIVSSEGATVNGPGGSVTLPLDVGRYNRIVDGVPTSGYVTRISVVSYEVAKALSTTGGSGRGGALVRSVDWGRPTEVASIESMEIRYFVGGMVPGPIIEYRRPPGTQFRAQGGGGRFSTDSPPGSPTGAADSPPDGNRIPPRKDREGNPPFQESRRGEPRYEDRELTSPPNPQPDPNSPLDEANIVRGVRITVTSRSNRGNLMGSELLATDSSDATSHIRQTFSTRVAPRNLLNQAGRRELTSDPGSSP